jgi:peptidyl-prolyl cis-trans isomerase SurA
MSPTPSESDLKDASRYLDSLKTLVMDKKESFERLAKEYSDVPETKGNGGFFTDANGSMKMAVDELDPVIFFKLDSMKVGDISEPLTYRTDDQKSAVLIIFYKSRMKAHEASLKDDWQRIYGAALNEKKDKALQKWFEGARQDVFINIDPTHDFCGILDQ